MENTLEIFDQNYLDEYISEHHLCVHERATMGEMVAAVRNGDGMKLEWFRQFGTELRHILLNSYAYRKGLVFGFDEIAFDEYGWLKRPFFFGSGRN